MNIIKVTIHSVSKKPVIIILPAVAALICCIINNYNPVLPVVLGISSATGGSFFDGIISILQLLMEPNVIASVAIFAAGAVILVSLLAGLILSGYFSIVGNTLEGIEKAKGEFKAGLKKYFFKVFVITIKAALSAGFISGIMVIATVPAIIITRASAVTKPELMPAALLVDILTAGVLFFGFMFLRVYLFYWYPAVIKDMAKPFRRAKQFVDRYFWSILSRLAVFDVVFAVFLYFFLNTSSALLKLLFGTIFITIFITMLIIYIFNSFTKIMISNTQDDRS